MAASPPDPARASIPLRGEPPTHGWFAAADVQLRPGPMGTVPGLVVAGVLAAAVVVLVTARSGAVTATSAGLVWVLTSIAVAVLTRTVVVAHRIRRHARGDLVRIEPRSLMWMLLVVALFSLARTVTGAGDPGAGSVRWWTITLLGAAAAGGAGGSLLSGRRIRVREGAAPVRR